MPLSLKQTSGNNTTGIRKKFKNLVTTVLGNPLKQKIYPHFNIPGNNLDK